MNSEFKKSFYAATILFILLGAVMAAFSKGAPQIVAFALGCALTLYGAVRLLMCCKKDGFTLGNGMIRSIIVLLLGALVLRWNEIVTTAVITLVGAALTTDGVLKLQLANMLKIAGAPTWKRDAIGAAVFTVIGIFLMFDPFKGKQAMTVITGVALVLSGIANLWLIHEMKNAEPKKPDAPAIAKE